RAAGQPRSGGAAGGLAGRRACGPCGGRGRPARGRRRRRRAHLQPRTRGAALDRPGRHHRGGGPGALTVTTTFCVVGGGISGLAAAYRLRVSAGPDASIVLFDPADRLGGILRTERLGGQPLDVGAEAFIVRRPEVPALLAELGLTDRQRTTTGARPLIYSQGRTHPLPQDTLQGIPAHAAALTGLVDDATLTRIADEPSRPLTWSPGADPSVAELVG